MTAGGSEPLCFKAPDHAAPFCARCRDMGAHHGGIEHLHQMRRLAHRRQGIEERFESSRSAQPPEPLPHAVPAPEFLRKSPPSNIMNHKIVQGFEKLSKNTDCPRVREKVIWESLYPILGSIRPHGLIRRQNMRGGADLKQQRLLASSPPNSPIVTCVNATCLAASAAICRSRRGIRR